MDSSRNMGSVDSLNTLSGITRETLGEGFHGLDFKTMNPATLTTMQDNVSSTAVNTPWSDKEFTDAASAPSTLPQPSPPSQPAPSPIEAKAMEIASHIKEPQQGLLKQLSPLTNGWIGFLQSEANAGHFNPNVFAKIVERGGSDEQIKYMLQKNSAKYIDPATPQAVKDAMVNCVKQAMTDVGKQSGCVPGKAALKSCTDKAYSKTQNPALKQLYEDCADELAKMTQKHFFRQTSKMGLDFFARQNVPVYFYLHEYPMNPVKPLDNMDWSTRGSSQAGALKPDGTLKQTYTEPITPSELRHAAHIITDLSLKNPITFVTIQ
jgi:hypothetical protein